MEPDACWKLVILNSAACSKSVAAKHLWKELIAPRIGNLGRLIEVASLEAAQAAGLRRLPALFLQRDVFSLQESRGGGRVYEGGIVLKYLPRLTDHIEALLYAAGRPVPQAPHAPHAPSTPHGRADAAYAAAGREYTLSSSAAQGMGGSPAAGEEAPALPRTAGNVLMHDSGSGVFLRHKNASKQKGEEDPSMDPAIAARAAAMRAPGAERGSTAVPSIATPPPGGFLTHSSAAGTGGGAGRGGGSGARGEPVVAPASCSKEDLLQGRGPVHLAGEQGATFLRHRSSAAPPDDAGAGVGAGAGAGAGAGEG